MLWFLLSLLRGLFLAGYVKSASFPQPLRPEEERLRALMYRSLKRRERLVLSLRFGLEGAPPMTQQQVADRIGISRSYISRIEKKAVMKLRLALLEEGEGPDAPWGGAIGKKDL